MEGMAFLRRTTRQGKMQSVRIDNDASYDAVDEAD